jgi:16S rRNA (guanine966-N2)-methyltransferase
MRIIAGNNRGRILKTLPGLHTRPMMDRMKESVFNIIGPYFSGGNVLDLFGGSGALSFEALSRGATLSYIVEINPAALRIIDINAHDLNEKDRIMLFRCDYQAALRKFKSDGVKFDLVFLDPPYKLKVIGEVLDYLVENAMLNDGAYIVCHYMKGNHEPEETEALALVKSYAYATNAVAIYQKK